MKSYKNLIYALLCLCLSMIMGAAVYEHLAIWPRAFSAPPQSLSMFQGEYALNSDAFWPIIHLITLLLFIVTLIISWKSDRKKNVLISFIGYILIMIVTSIYFVPELVDIISSEFNNSIDQQLLNRASRWVLLSWIRQLFGIVIVIYLYLGLTKGNNEFKEK